MLCPCCERAGARNPLCFTAVSGIRPPLAECNFGLMEAMRAVLGCDIGWSDHSVSAGVPARAVHRWWATTVKFHLDLDGSGDGSETGLCWLPDQITLAIRLINNGFGAHSDGTKRPKLMESVARLWRADPAGRIRQTTAMRRTLHYA